MSKKWVLGLFIDVKFGPAIFMVLDRLEVTALSAPRGHPYASETTLLAGDAAGRRESDG
jgi:hypothetical protein